MFSAWRLILIILIILAFGALTIFSFVKFNYNQDELIAKNKQSNKLVYTVERGGQLLLGFFNFLSKPNWLGWPDEPIIKEKPPLIDELDYDYGQLIEGPIEIFSDDLNSFKDISFRDIFSSSYKTSNWRLLWNDYWQKQAGWFKKEWENIRIE